MKQIEAFISWLIFTLIAMAILVFSFMNGRFGRRVLKQPYRNIWRVIWGLLFVYVAFTYVAVPFFNWWSEVINSINYVIWG